MTSSKGTHCHLATGEENDREKSKKSVFGGRRRQSAIEKREVWMSVDGCLVLFRLSSSPLPFFCLPFWMSELECWIGNFDFYFYFYFYFKEDWCGVWSVCSFPVPLILKLPSQTTTHSGPSESWNDLLPGGFSLSLLSSLSLTLSRSALNRSVWMQKKIL